MARQWIKVEGDIINADYVALVDRQGDHVSVHLAVPQLPDNVRVPVPGMHPTYTGHVVRVYSLAAWEAAWEDALDTTGLPT